MTPANRRRLLVGALAAGAAATVASIPAVAAAETPDPVFARIEALNAATAPIRRYPGYRQPRRVRGGLPH
jgi:hypothetical protein